MVSRKISKSKALKLQRQKRAKILFLANFTILALCMIIIIFCLIFDVKNEEIKNDNPSFVISDIEIPTENIEKPEKVNFQSVVDEWVKTVAVKKSVLIYDLENEEISAEYNTKAYYNIASLYKLFVVYEGYRKIENREWEKDMPVGMTGYTVLECLDLAIRESNSICAETLLSLIGRENLNEIIKNDYMVNSDVLSLAGNAEDINKIMKIFYEHKDIKDETLISRMKDSFLVQPQTTHNWRQGLPSGFEKANVYNKVGWEYNEDEGHWNIYHDSAIVEFPEENRHFIVIVMTENTAYQKIKNLGTLIENYFYSN